MKKYPLVYTFVFSFLIFSANLNSQNSLTIEKIMQGDRFTGFSPDNLRWSPSGSILYFEWNPDMDTMPSLYSVRRDNLKPQRVGIEERKELPSLNGIYNRESTILLHGEAIFSHGISPMVH